MCLELHCYTTTDGTQGRIVHTRGRAVGLAGIQALALSEESHVVSREVEAKAFETDSVDPCAWEVVTERDVVDVEIVRADKESVGSGIGVLVIGIDTRNVAVRILLAPRVEDILVPA